MLGLGLALIPYNTLGSRNETKTLNQKFLNQNPKAITLDLAADKERALVLFDAREPDVVSCGSAISARMKMIFGLGFWILEARTL